ncbi:MAG TPA: thioesterase family protein [Dermatophilaceae bacterium]|nr:thioesterase family protein [Dermatophilaceae bacterium]
MPPAPTTVNVPLRWSDMDAYGHVNNTEFVRLLEEARVAGWHEWFGDAKALELGIVVARHEIDYLAQLGHRREPVAVDIWVSRLGGAGYDLGYIVRDPDGVGAGTRYAVAETSLALFDFAAGRPRRMTEHERATLGAHLGDPAPLRRRR